MGIESNHVEYAKYNKSWTRCRDSVDGSDAIKDKSQKYLPALPGMGRVSAGKELYNLYLDNALWYPGTGRTFDAYIGTLFRKPATKEIPAAMDIIDDVFTPDGQTIDGFAADLAGEIVMGYRPGILIDYPDIDTEGMSIAELESNGGRPYAILYPADRIMDWEQSLINGQLSTTRVTIEERVTLEKATGKYETGGNELHNADGYAVFRRVLSLEGIYTQKLYVQTDDKNKQETEWVLVKTNTPMMNNEALDFIPFIPVTQKGTIWALGYPLINDIAVLNIADYRNEALYRDALLFNGRPTPCVSKLITEQGQKAITLGSSSILQFEEGGTWGTLGGGADAAGLKESGNDLKQKMALVGSRALAEDPRGVEAAETASLHRQGEDGVLTSIGVAVSAGMTKALEIMRDWFPSVEGDVLYEVNTDFIPGNVDPARMQAMWVMLQDGKISYDTFYSYLERGEVYPVGWTIEQEKEAIAATDKLEGETLDIGGDDLAGNAEEAVKVATLNGIQIKAANEIISAVATGALTRAAAVNQLTTFLGLTVAQANAVMEGVVEGSLSANPTEAS